MTATCVRPLARADVPALLAIEAQANPSPWRAPDFEAFAEADPSAGAERKAWVYADPEVRGFLCAMAAAGEAELQSIAVERARWSRGAGSALMDALFAWARERGLEAIHLEVREGNQRARDFYARHGFAAVGRRPKYYQDNGEAAVLMKRSPI